MTIVPEHALRVLPHVFHVADLTIRFGWSPTVCVRHLFFWRQRGLVSELGVGCGVFVNLAVRDYPDWELALRVIMPSAVVIGIEILRRSGWTTQIPWAPTVAVSSRQRVYQVPHFEVVPLPPEWFHSTKRGVLSGEEVALPQLSPAWALADLVSREGWCDCGVGPDDIYWDLVTASDERDWAEACRALGLGKLSMTPVNSR